MECKFYLLANKEFNNKLEWFFSPRGFKTANKYVKIHIKRSKTVNNLSLCDNRQCISNITETFLLVNLEIRTELTPNVLYARLSQGTNYVQQRTLSSLMTTSLISSYRKRKPLDLKSCRT